MTNIVGLRSGSHPNTMIITSANPKFTIRATSANPSFTTRAFRGQMAKKVATRLTASSRSSQRWQAIPSDSARLLILSSKNSSTVRCRLE